MKHVLVALTGLAVGLAAPRTQTVHVDRIAHALSAVDARMVDVALEKIAIDRALEEVCKSLIELAPKERREEWRIEALAVEFGERRARKLMERVDAECERTALREAAVEHALDVAAKHFSVTTAFGDVKRQRPVVQELLWVELAKLGRIE